MAADQVFRGENDSKELKFCIEFGTILLDHGFTWLLYIITAICGSNDCCLFTNTRCVCSYGV
jgi:hypothetical protein